MTEYTEHVYKEYHGKTYEPLHQREEVVRCRDCKHYDTDDAASEVYSNRYWCNKICRYMPSCGYCSWGERR